MNMDSNGTETTNQTDKRYSPSELSDMIDKAISMLKFDDKFGEMITTIFDRMIERYDKRQFSVTEYSYFFNTFKSRCWERITKPDIPHEIISIYNKAYSQYLDNFKEWRKTVEIDNGFVVKK